MLRTDFRHGSPSAVTIVWRSNSNFFAQQSCHCEILPDGGGDPSMATGHSLETDDRMAGPTLRTRRNPLEVEKGVVEVLVVARAVVMVVVVTKAGFAIAVVTEIVAAAAAAVEALIDIASLCAKFIHM